MNSIFVIHPYKHNGMWVFDDDSVGLVREPFISGADTIIDELVKEIPDAGNGFRLLFSTVPFPGHNAVLTWLREEAGGNWYYCKQLQMEGWLCPALYKYFEIATEKLFIKVEARA